MTRGALLSFIDQFVDFGMMPEDQFLGQAPLRVPALLAELESLNAENVRVLTRYRDMFSVSKRKVTGRHPVLDAMRADERFNGEAWSRLCTDEGWLGRNASWQGPGCFVSLVYAYIEQTLRWPGAQFVVEAGALERAYLTPTEVRQLETGKKRLPSIDPVGHLRDEYDEKGRRMGSRPVDVSLADIVTWKIPDGSKQLLVQRIFAESIYLLHSRLRQASKSAGEYRQHFNRNNLPRLSARQKKGSSIATELPRGFFG